MSEQLIFVPREANGSAVLSAEGQPATGLRGGMKMRVSQALSAIGMAAALTLGMTATAHAQTTADPKTPYNVQYGNSYVKGNLIWYNRSVQVGGQLRAASGCRDAVYTAFSGDVIKDREVRSTCNGTVGHGFTLTVDVAGGATRVDVDLYENGTLRDFSICTRSGCRQ